jgi:hypothetical protein
MTPLNPRFHTVELAVGGLDDPDGSKAATVLGAYLRAEHTRAFRQLLWPRLAALAVIWSVIGSVTPLFPGGVMVSGLALFVAIAVGAAVAEWRASENLLDLIRLRESLPNESSDTSCRASIAN